jgi:hypothetical protein
VLVEVARGEEFGVLVMASLSDRRFGAETLGAPSQPTREQTSALRVPSVRVGEKRVENFIGRRGGGHLGGDVPSTSAVGL